MIKLKPIIESKYTHDQELYHYTSLIKLYKICISNELRGRSYYPKLNTNSKLDMYSVSFSRSKQWLYDTSISKKFGVDNECAIIFDANKLSNKYKLYPYSFFNEYPQPSGYSKTTRHEFEERILLVDSNKLLDVKSYIRGILLSKKELFFSTDESSAIDLIVRLNDIIPNSRYSVVDLESPHMPRYVLNFLRDKIEDDLKLRVDII